MSILITGIDMPTKGNPITVLIYPDGTAEWEAQNKAGIAVPVPPHGRLIDADELAEMCDEPHWCAWLSDIDNAPTIIPAEEAPAKDTNVPIGAYDLLYEEGGPDA